MRDLADAMAALDEIVERRREDDRYPVALTLYEASLEGLLAVPITPQLLYRWVVKWATLPEARGVR